jgi:fatty-acid desaturase
VIEQHFFKKTKINIRHMLKFSFNFKLQLLWILCHIWFVMILFTEFNLLYLLIGYIWYVVIKGIGSEIGAHRYFSHKSFNTTKIKENILIWLQLLCGEGSVLTFVGVHRMHHAYSDTSQDPHSPLYKPFWKIIYFIDTVEIKPFFVKGLSQIKQIKMQHKIYFYVHIILIIIGIFYPIFYGYFVALPIILSVYTNSIVNILLHKYGTMNINQRDNSRNNEWANIILYGAGYHSKHHQNPQCFKLNDKWYKDILGYIIDRWIALKAK